jgi:hypothetical protein
VVHVTIDAESESTVHVDPPTVTVALARLDPDSVITVPPAVGPALGFTSVTVGAATYVKPPVIVVVPPVVEITTFAGPAVPDGVVHTIVFDASEVMSHVAPPTVTVAEARLEPSIVTEVPPIVGPSFGDMDVTPGACV